MAFISAAYFGNPAQKLKTIGITGTKGKTTTTYLIRSMLENAGHKVGLIGTIEVMEYSLVEVMDACRYYFEQTGRQLTFEYALVGGVNDTQADATELSHLLQGLNCIVNLIPVNPIKERNYVETGHSEVVAFKNKLEKSKINVTIRREMGRDIDGACGQLRRRHLHDWW